MPGDTGQGRSWRREAGGDLKGARARQFLPALLLVRDVRLFISTGKNEAVL